MKFVNRVGQVWEGAIDLVGWDGLYLIVRSELANDGVYVYTRHTTIRIETGELVNANEIEDWIERDAGVGTWTMVG